MKNSSIYKTNDRIRHTVMAVICTISLFSCVRVDFCAEDQHPHMGNLKVTYHWPEDGNEHPDSMLLLINRIVNTRRIGYVTHRETSIGGRYRFGKVYHNEGIIDNDALDKEPLIVSAGEYQIFAFNSDMRGRDGKTIYRLDSLNEYSCEKHSTSVGIRDLGISYIGRDLSSLNSYDTDWEEAFNNYSKYIDPETPPVYRAMNLHNEETQEYTVNIHTNDDVEVHLYPQKITQDITFSFPIYTDKEVKINDIIAEISGIPRKMMVYTGAIVADTTYKMLFKIGIDHENTKKATLKMEENGYVVDKEFTQTECLGDISVIGLLANQDPKHRTGAGILVLRIYAQTTNDDGEIKTKTQTVKINLYNTIRKANLLIKNDDGSIMQNPGTDPERPLIDTLRIDGSQLILTRDLILQTTDDDISVDTWEKTENGDINIDA